MSDPTSRSSLVARLASPVAPAEPELAARFADLPADRRRAVSRAALDPARAADDPDPALVRALAEAHATRVVPPMLGALGLAVLVLMTVWGFGRSASPENAPAFLLAGGLAGLVTLQLAGRRYFRRLARARRVHELLSGRQAG